ncbi:TRAP transporter solute receptor, unknown substrate 1 [Halanaerobium saccharolyticum subsp. saccharolyticum DSM 6643]|uniref:TRAP transporter TAXI family solute receptor n=1 Tax=Halanaerobium saccharolyticum subsp. saccharolyticum DSM 6643 TaxID=1293054 RepID=M5E375_9FIRM|nr:TAXI family TRAP transporter solute-binding subunit [Halanaerobium saccharolyticum]CCU80707.1 TRAP transporter solute receptor, unknown substrate 1 [Halanaerobium saccharolyticum subsp. saccharolyticum DSM 6643]
MLKSKNTLFILSAVLVISLLLSGMVTAQGTTFLSIATGGTSGTYYPIGGALAKVLNENIDNMNASAQSTGASVTNTRLIYNQEVELAILQNDIANYAVNGERQFEGNQVNNMSGVASLYPEVIQIIVRSDAGINNIADLKGKSVAVGAPGSGAEANASQILDFFGLSYDDIEEDYLSFGEAASRLKDRQIDAAFLTAGIPTAAVMDVAATQDIKLLNFSDQDIESLNEAYPYLTGVTVPAGTYNGLDNDVQTVALQAILVAESSLSEDVVYNITKAIFENRDTLIAAHDRARDITLDGAMSGMTVELHPGAQKYYDEVK